MKKKTDSTISLPVWAQLLLPVLVTVLCAGIVLLCSIRPYEQAKTYLKVAFMAGSTSAAGESTNGLNIVQTDIDTDYTGKTDSEGYACRSGLRQPVCCAGSEIHRAVRSRLLRRRLGTAGAGSVSDHRFGSAGGVGKLRHQRTREHLFPRPVPAASG